jgi:XisI protein
MDKLKHHRNIVKQVITEHAQLMQRQPLPGEEVVTLFDEATDNYMLLRLGWVRGKRLYSITLHLRLVDGKVRVEQDWTEDAVAELVAAGVPREDMVLAFNPPGMQQANEFAIA